MMKHWIRDELLLTLFAVVMIVLLRYSLPCSDGAVWFAAGMLLSSWITLSDLRVVLKKRGLL